MAEKNEDRHMTTIPISRTKLKSKCNQNQRKREKGREIDSSYQELANEGEVVGVSSEEKG